MSAGNGFLTSVTAAQDGDARALGDLLEGFRPYLLAVANAALPDDLRGKGGGSDLVQETLLEAHRDLPRFTGEQPDDLRAWLRGILRNNLADWVKRFRDSGRRAISQERALRAEEVSVIADPDLTPGARAVAREEAEALDAALRRLTEDDRQVILLRNERHLPWDEVGRQLGCGGEAARKRWARAIGRLQGALEPNRR